MCWALQSTIAIIPYYRTTFGFLETQSHINSGCRLLPNNERFYRAWLANIDRDANCAVKHALLLLKSIFLLHLGLQEKAFRVIFRFNYYAGIFGAIFVLCDKRVLAMSYNRVAPLSKKTSDAQHDGKESGGGGHTVVMEALQKPVPRSNQSFSRNS